MKLTGIEIVSAGQNGLRLPRQGFGKRVTQLFGPNGSGKTPVVQSLMFCLGYPAIFRDDIYERCHSVIVSLELGGTQYKIGREFNSLRTFTVSSPEGVSQEFYNESDFTKHMFSLFGLSMPKLVSVHNKPEDPYLSTLLPLFYLDQDNGYTGIYKSPSNYIKDQYTEMLRLIMGFGPKNSFEKKRATLQMKETIAALDREIVTSRQLVLSKQKDVEQPRRSTNEIALEIEALNNELSSIKNSTNQTNDALIALDGIIDGKKRSIRKLTIELSELSEKIQGIESIKREIESEINTLSLNDEAKRVFDSFQEICSSDECGLFRGSSESYGKNLLYLRDQIKDLERNTDTNIIRYDEIVRKKQEQEQELRELIDKRISLHGKDGKASIVEAIGQLSRRVFELERLMSIMNFLENEEQKYIRLSNERESAQNKLADMGGTGAVEDLKFVQLRGILRKRIANWLDILVATNISRDISVDSNLVPIFGKETVEQFKGSTKTRAVLATHAAIFETYLDNDSNEFRIFIMDTPKQQEMQTEHLSDFISKLADLAKNKNAQIIFSTTEFHYVGNKDDAEWNPQFSGEIHDMYMGLPAQPLIRQ